MESRSGRGKEAGLDLVDGLLLELPLGGVRVVRGVPERGLLDDAPVAVELEHHRFHLLLEDLALPADLLAPEGGEEVPHLPPREGVDVGKELVRAEVLDALQSGHGLRGVLSRLDRRRGLGSGPLGLGEPGGDLDAPAPNEVTDLVRVGDSQNDGAAAAVAVLFVVGDEREGPWVQRRTKRTERQAGVGRGRTRLGGALVSVRGGAHLLSRRRERVRAWSSFFVPAVVTLVEHCFVRLRVVTLVTAGFARLCVFAGGDEGEAEKDGEGSASASFVRGERLGSDVSHAPPREKKERKKPSGRRRSGEGRAGDVGGGGARPISPRTALGLTLFDRQKSVVLWPRSRARLLLWFSFSSRALAITEKKPLRPLFPHTATHCFLLSPPPPWGVRGFSVSPRRNPEYFPEWASGASDSISPPSSGLPKNGNAKLTTLDRDEAATFAKRRLLSSIRDPRVEQQPTNERANQSTNERASIKSIKFP